MDFEIRFQGLDGSDPLREHAELLEARGAYYRLYSMTYAKLEATLA